MAPLAEMANQVHEMAKRGRCDYDSYGRPYCYSAWYYYGRWILLGVCILCVFLSVFLMARRNSRRRRMHGAAPVYGTGWMAPAPPPYAPPPQYSAQPPPGSQGGYYAPNGNGPKPEQNGPGAYYPNQQEGVQLQQPASAYHRGPDEQFTPPEGPPPNQARRYQ